MLGFEYFEDGKCYMRDDDELYPSWIQLQISRAKYNWGTGFLKLLQEYLQFQTHVFQISISMPKLLRKSK